MGEVNTDELNLEELGLVEASEVEALRAQLAEKEAAIERLKVGFARVQELGLRADQLEIVADMSEEAYQLLKEQRQKTEVQAGEEEPEDNEPHEDKPGQLQGSVLEAGDDSGNAPLTWEQVPNILKM